MSHSSSFVNTLYLILLIEAGRLAWNTTVTLITSSIFSFLLNAEEELEEMGLISGIFPVQFLIWDIEMVGRTHDQSY